MLRVKYYKNDFYRIIWIDRLDREESVWCVKNKIYQNSSSLMVSLIMQTS